METLGLVSGLCECSDPGLADQFGAHCVPRINLYNLVWLCKTRKPMRNSLNLKYLSSQ